MSRPSTIITAMKMRGITNQPLDQMFLSLVFITVSPAERIASAGTIV
ncbi:MAG: hypothetical protein J5822_03760 [Eubacteriaceae bacterium]|nr:hypothetical protein [Eubacteriaceae bacterium]